ncbi:hypothetical protein TNCV_3653331 [Trichonephila clavipes]|nr:hypothetical protein TNCV_3653331 [Trichonephila clavipes]
MKCSQNKGEGSFIDPPTEGWEEALTLLVDEDEAGVGSRERVQEIVLNPNSYRKLVATFKNSRSNEVPMKERGSMKHRCEAVIKNKDNFVQL